MRGHDMGSNDNYCINIQSHNQNIVEEGWLGLMPQVAIAKSRKLQSS